MKAIITALESIAPTYPAVAPETERVPYILYSESDTPIVTFDGIAGYDTTLTVTVVASFLQITPCIARGTAVHWYFLIPP